MADRRPMPESRLAVLCRSVAAALISGVWRRRSIREVRDRLAALPGREEALIVGGVLAALLALSVAAAQFGILGLLAFWLAVVLIVN